MPKRTNTVRYLLYFLTYSIDPIHLFNNPPKNYVLYYIILLDIASTVEVFEVLDINVGVGWGDLGHVDTVEDDWDHVVGENLPELLRDVVPAQ